MSGEALYIPGVWKCPKCNFRLVQSNLNARDGTVTARDTPGDKCPNCQGPLWRVTWKDEALENLAIGEQQVARAVAAETEIASLQQELSDCKSSLRAVEAERDEARKQRDAIGLAWDSADARAKAAEEANKRLREAW